MAKQNGEGWWVEFWRPFVNECGKLLAVALVGGIGWALVRLALLVWGP